MYDGGKIIAGLLVFLALIASPIWYDLARGKTGAPDIVISETAKTSGQGKCIEDAAYMRAYHMDLLNQWRNAVVRQGYRVYVSSSGARHDMSFSNTCLRCHDNKAEFCDRCHNYEAVTPPCWTCHVNPPEIKP